MATVSGIPPAEHTPKGTSITTGVTNKAKKTGKSDSDLGKDDFMKLLLAQLQHQDPLKPMDDQQFIAQVAQFNALEQMTSVNKTLASVLNSQQLASASGMIGKMVSALDTEGKAITGIVTAASVEKGVSMVHIGDKKVALDKITGVASDAANLPPVPAAETPTDTTTKGKSTTSATNSSLRTSGTTTTP